MYIIQLAAQALDITTKLYHMTLMFSEYYHCIGSYLVVFKLKRYTVIITVFIIMYIATSVSTEFLMTVL